MWVRIIDFNHEDYPDICKICKIIAKNKDDGSLTFRVKIKDTP